MLHPRLIPCLLLDDRRLVKTTRFDEPRYIGDPVNTVNIFSGLRADEIMLLDIRASAEDREPDYRLLEAVAQYATVPLAYGGGLRTVADVRKALALGCEKVVLGTAAGDRLDFVSEVAALAGAQAVVVSIDVRRDPDGTPVPYVRSGQRRLPMTAIDYAIAVTRAGAGELLLHSIDREGTMQGYDVPLAQAVAAAVSVPVIACGGARTRSDMVEVIRDGNAQAAAAGSIFVYQKDNRSVLVNYPELPLRRKLLG